MATRRGPFTQDSSQATRSNAEQDGPGPVLANLQEAVPELFFAADFDIQDMETFKNACPLHIKDETSLSKCLTGYLDTVRVPRHFLYVRTIMCPP
jgi:hypothetical protein